MTFVLACYPLCAYLIGMLGLLSLLGQRLATISLVCAFVSLGFAHKAIPIPMTPDLATYVAAGGSIADLCGGAQLPGHEQSMDCEVCRLADNFAMSQGCNVIPSKEQVQARTWRFVAKRLAESQELDPTRLTRAPPYV